MNLIHRPLLVLITNVELSEEVILIIKRINIRKEKIKKYKIILNKINRQKKKLSQKKFKYNKVAKVKNSNNNIVIISI